MSDFVASKKLENARTRTCTNAQTPYRPGLNDFDRNLLATDLAGPELAGLRALTQAQ
jgi:hypothetical protein